MRYHSFLRADAESLVPGERTQLRVGLQPVSFRFPAGHCIRISLAGADADNFAVLHETRPESIIDRGPPLASRIDLPLENPGDPLG